MSSLNPRVKLNCYELDSLRFIKIDMLTFALEKREESWVDKVTISRKSKDHMVNFPVLSHSYGLVTSPSERAVIQIQNMTN